jgi:hypothetical protein
MGDLYLKVALQKADLEAKIAEARDRGETAYAQMLERSLDSLTGLLMKLEGEA